MGRSNGSFTQTFNKTESKSKRDSKIGLKPIPYREVYPEDADSPKGMDKYLFGISLNADLSQCELTISLEPRRKKNVSEASF